MYLLISDIRLDLNIFLIHTTYFNVMVMEIHLLIMLDTRTRFSFEYHNCLGSINIYLIDKQRYFVTILLNHVVEIRYKENIIMSYGNPSKSSS